MFSFQACRICFKADDYLVPTASKYSEGISFNDLLLNFTNEITWTSDSHPSLICSECAEKLRKAYELKMKILRAEVTRKEYITETFKENKIPISFATKSSQRKQNSHTEYPDYIDKENCYCKSCERKFSKLSTLLGHIRNIHTLEKNYVCDSCEAAFTNYGLLKRHKAKHKGVPDFVCFNCGKGFLTSSDLHHHLQRHQNVCKYRCGVCEKGFKTASNLASHKMTVHTKIEGRKYLCSHCGQKCVTQATFNVHMKRHLNIKDFRCDICQKRFVTRNELLKHTDAHTNVRLHKCETCGREYKQNSVLKSHMIRKHGVVGKMKCDKVFIGVKEEEKTKCGLSNCKTMFIN